MQHAPAQQFGRQVDQFDLVRAACLLVGKSLPLRETGICRTIGLTTDALRAYTARDAALWSAFFAHLADSLLPDLFLVRLFLGRGADAVPLADTEFRKREALERCAASPRLDDVGRAPRPAEAQPPGTRLSGGRAVMHQEWGLFEEAAARPVEAARHTEDAGNLYPHRLYRAAERFGDADGVRTDGVWGWSDQIAYYLDGYRLAPGPALRHHLTAQAPHRPDAPGPDAERGRQARANRAQVITDGLPGIPRDTAGRVSRDGP
ncbi:hypothetical protein AB0B78_10935 [Streptomyces sp. NPDC040724]|uniref:hypothetical protein n=1 Tax=Streptomyces sp. NPDC040724 TaxID=3155612 RepID=UPI0033CEA62C